ncbi:MAG: nucleoside 2-deoxyribosyltransferase [Caldisericaceae bacterium]|nr:nucleoside 2-deoxyribosyltransferase [Caldisericaceae bacterium]
MKVYVAEPLFTPGERRYAEEIDALVRDLGFNTYLPHRDAGVFERGKSSSRTFFENDLKELKECAFVVAILNGTDVDSGTAWEIGYAYAIGKPVYGILEDTRKPTLDLLNPMIVNSIVKIALNKEELETTLKEIKSIDC